MPEKPGLPQISIGLPVSLKLWVKKKAERESRSISGQIRYYLEKAKREEAGK